jgi:hypothetical protein
MRDIICDGASCSGTDEASPEIRSHGARSERSRVGHRPVISASPSGYAENFRQLGIQLMLHGRLFDPLSCQPSMTMRLRQVFAVAIIFSASPSGAEPCCGGWLSEHIQNFEEYPATAKVRHADDLVIRPSLPVSDNLPNNSGPFGLPAILVSDQSKKEPDTIIFASMSGKCPTLKIAGRNFACRAVAFYQTEVGRANFAIALDDPTDNSHIVTFSGENGRREQGDLYELPVDRMLLKSKDRPKADGLPVPLVELSTGTCKQLGNFAASEVSSVSCIAIDTKGEKYELQFESDGSPMKVLRLRESPVPTDQQRAKQVAQFECRLKADAAKVLRRDRSAYIIHCLGEDSQEPATTGHQ